MLVKIKHKMNIIELLTFSFCLTCVEPRYGKIDFTTRLVLSCQIQTDNFYSVLMDDMEMTQDTYNTFFSDEAAQRASVSVLGGFRLWDTNKTDGKWVIPYAFKSNMIGAL